MLANVSGKASNISIFHTLTSEWESPIKKIHNNITQSIIDTIKKNQRNNFFPRRRIKVNTSDNDQ